MSKTDKEGMSAIGLLARFYCQHEDAFKQYILRAVENYHTQSYLLGHVSVAIVCVFCDEEVS